MNGTSINLFGKNIPINFNLYKISNALRAIEWASSGGRILNAAKEFHFYSISDER